VTSCDAERVRDPALRPLLVVEHEGDAGPGRLLPFLGAVDVRRPYAGDALPADLAGHRGIVVLGGEVCAWDDDKAPWLPETRRLLAAAASVGLPVLGVCLGAQLLAMATGGRVEPGGAGLEVGLTPIRVLATGHGDPLFGAVLGGLDGADEFDAPQYHRDAITRLPPDAELLAVGDVYGVQAFRVGDRAWGVQYHPEVTDEDFARWTAGGHASLVAEGHDPDALLESVTSRTAYLDRIARTHGARFGSIAPAAG
jgi:GMP synthase-like glutamine amidotransferase